MTDEFGREENTYGQDPAYPVITAETIHSEAEAAELEQLYAQLKPEAIAEARKYVLARTPAKFQQDMADLIATDFPPPPDPPLADDVRADRRLGRAA